MEEQVKENTDLMKIEDEEIVIPSSSSLLKKIKETVFEEGIHYFISKNKKGEESVFFKKQASSVLSELFGVSVKVISIKVEGYVPPAEKNVYQDCFELAKELMFKGQSKEAGKLIEYAKELAREKNPAEWWDCMVLLEGTNGKRTIQWAGSGTNALQNVAVSTAMTRAFRNLIRAFSGI